MAKVLKKDLTKYSKLVAQMLGHVFSIHGTEDILHVQMVNYYEAMVVRLTCINEVIDKQTPDVHLLMNILNDDRIDYEDYMDNKTHNAREPKPDSLKKIILKEFGTRAKFVKECFLSFKSFEPEKLTDLLPVIEDIEDLIKKTKITKGLVNEIDSYHPDSS